MQFVAALISDSKARNMLRAQNVTVSYAHRERRQDVFADLSFELRSSESLVLFGESGSGKTTLLNLIAGLQCPDSGRLLFGEGDDAVDMASVDESVRSAVRRSKMGIVFQFFNLIPTLSLAENCLLPLELNGLPTDGDAVRQSLAELGLGDKTYAYPDEISGGEQQRVAVLRALIHGPSLLLADEPTGNPALNNSRAVADLLWDAVDEASSSLIVATHSAALAERADRVLEMDSLKT